MADQRALTIGQPWAWAIVAGHKDVENRKRRTHFRGRFLVHAARWCDGQVVAEWRREDDFAPLMPDKFVTGAIIGAVDLIGCVRRHDSVWAEPGRFHWLLANAAMLDEPVPHRGRLNFWTPERRIRC